MGRKTLGVLGTLGLIGAVIAGCIMDKTCSEETERRESVVGMEFSEPEIIDVKFEEVK